MQAAAGDAKRSGRANAAGIGVKSHWTADTRPDGRGTAFDPATKVTFGRVSRDKVADVLPKLVSGAAPLRAMMEKSR